MSSWNYRVVYDETDAHNLSNADLLSDLFNLRTIHRFKRVSCFKSNVAVVEVKDRYESLPNLNLPSYFYYAGGYYYKVSEHDAYTSSKLICAGETYDLTDCLFLYSFRDTQVWFKNALTIYRDISDGPAISIGDKKIWTSMAGLFYECY